MDNYQQTLSLYSDFIWTSIIAVKPKVDEKAFDIW